MIRENFEQVKEKLQTRDVPEETLTEFLRLDKKRRSLLVETEEMKKNRNNVSEKIAQAKRNKEDTSEQIAEMREVGSKIKALDKEIATIDEKLNTIATTLPNLPHDSVPVGKDEEDNVEIRKWGASQTFSFEPKNHWEIGENLNILDFERGAKVSGSRFVYYKGLGARLERALYNFMLDQHVYQQGYTEMITPYAVNSQTMFGTGKFPKFTEDVFQLEDSGLTLIPTAEVPLTNYYSNEILDVSQLPVYFTALSPAFRSEAGSAGTRYSSTDPFTSI